MIGKKLPAVFRIVFAIWVILQVFLVVKYWDMPNHDDALAYVKLASECIARGTWYPDMHNQYEDFIFGPGYVNLLISNASSSKRHGDDKVMVRARQHFLDCPVAEFIDEYCNGI